MIIGITGETGCGKDTVAMYLAEKGFVHYALSDIIREKLREDGKELTRENEIAKGNELREKQGPGVLAEETLKKIEEGKKYVITSIRHPAEVDVLKTLSSFAFIKLTTPQHVRYERWNQRDDRDRINNLSFEEFAALDARELQGGKNDQNILACMEMAHDVITNDCSIEELKERVSRIVSKLESGDKRLSWDEYFMGIANEVRKRATCDRGKSGCIIVKDKRILTTGYVGSPVGLAHCDDAGHLLRDAIREGDVHKHCVRTVHSEQNALMQAARHGIPIGGATIYCCPMEPCEVCAKLLINAGVKRVVANKSYHGAELSRKFFKEAGVELEVLNDELENYKDMKE